MHETDMIDKNLMALQQILTAAALIQAANNTGTEFTDELLPACTEEWLEQLGHKLNYIAVKIGAA